MDECPEAEKAEALRSLSVNQPSHLTTKLLSVVMFIRNIEVEAEAIAEAKITDARKALKQKQTGLKTY